MQRKCHEGPDGEDEMLLSQSFSKREQGQRFLEAVTLGLRPQARISEAESGEGSIPGRGKGLCKVN